MELFRIRGVRIDGVSACVPENRIDNEIALSEMYGSEASLIIESTGIRTRYLASPGTTTSDLCAACAEDLLKGTGTAPEEIGAVVFVTFTPDRKMPFNAALVQERLGLPKGIPSFDVNLACSGYAYGLYLAASLCASCKKKALLLDGDVQNTVTSQKDKATAPVLADGGSATLLSFDGGSDEWTFTFYTDGSGRGVLTIPAGGTEHPETAADLAFEKKEDGGERRNTDIYMDGFAVFRFVAMDVSKWLKAFMDELGENTQTIDSFVPHQANMYMIKKLAKKLGFDWDGQTWQSGHAVGNSASATVPVSIAFDHEAKLKKEKTNRVLISGFGAGLSASAGIITLDPKAYYRFFQYTGKTDGK